MKSILPLVVLLLVGAGCADSIANFDLSVKHDREADLQVADLPSNDLGTLVDRDNIGAESPRPDTHLPDAGAPDVARPDVAKPDVAKPDVAKPDVAKPDVAKSDLAKSDGPTPDLPKPDTLKPDTLKPDTLKPDTLKPDTLKPDTQSPATVPGTWISITKGTFSMGSPTAESCREPSTSLSETQHSVTLTHNFEISATETTQGQFDSVMGYNPSFFPQWGVNNPVEKVTWHAAAAYCNALSAIAGKSKCYVASGSGTACTPPDPTDADPCPSGEACIVDKCVKYDVASAYASSIYGCPGYRLPTEAEWEYAYRAGTTSAFYNGGVVGTGSSCSPDTNAGDIGWYFSNTANAAPKNVGLKTKNAWQLADMAGNVWEWVNDWSQTDLGSTSATDPMGPSTGTKRVKRGGGYPSTATMLRAAQRDDSGPTTREGSLGFRCVRTK